MGMQAKMSFLMKHRFSILSWSVFAMVLIITWKGLFYGDFWEHSAVIRELSTNILNPRHPQLLLNVSHVFYSPYAVMVAFLSRLFQLNSIHALSLMVVINYWLFVIGLRYFIRNMFPQNYKAVAFYSLLLILFWWGWNPWPRSGFYHIGCIVLLLSYPSSLCMALSLIAISIYRQLFQKQNYLKIVLIIAIASFVMLSHPPTFIFLAVMLIAFSITENSIINRHLISCAIILSLASALATLWPYFSIIKLAMGQSTIYHQFNTQVYKGVFIKAWPAYLGIILVILQKRYTLRHQLVVSLVMLSVIYLYGYISGMYGYGRVISFIILVLHIIIAASFADWEREGVKYKKRLIMQSKYVCAAVVIICMVLSAVPLARIAYWTVTNRPPSYAEYLFLADYVGQYDVVLSDIESNWHIPSFGGKVVAVKHPIAFISDHDQRRDDVNLFFDSDTNTEIRLKVIRRYGVKYILLIKNDKMKWQNIIKSIALNGKIVYETDNKVLISIN